MTLNLDIFCPCTFNENHYEYVYSKLCETNIKHISELNNQSKYRDERLNSHYNNFVDCIIIHKQNFKAYLKLNNKNYNLISRKLRCGNKFLKKYSSIEEHNIKNNNNYPEKQKNILNFLKQDLNNRINNNNFLNKCLNKLKITPYYDCFLNRNIEENKNIEKNLENIDKKLKNKTKNKNLTEEEKLLYTCLIKNNDDAIKSINLQDENIKKNIEKIMTKKQLCNFTLKYDYTNMVNLNNVIKIENNNNMFDNYDILKLVNLCFKKESLKLLRNLLIKYITSKQYVEWLNLKTNNNIYNNGIVTSNNWFNHSFDLESIFPTKTYF